jgi:hypothetical protein
VTAGSRTKLQYTSGWAHRVRLCVLSTAT